MNRIILIGNGFDLAHGLKTSYKDFIDNFWEEEKKRVLAGPFIDYLFNNSIKYCDYEDDFIIIKSSCDIKFWELYTEHSDNTLIKRSRSVF
jgi:hypothetical protein